MPSGILFGVCRTVMIKQKQLSFWVFIFGESAFSCNCSSRPKEMNEKMSLLLLFFFFFNLFLQSSCYWGAAGGGGGGGGGGPFVLPPPPVLPTDCSSSHPSSPVSKRMSPPSQPHRMHLTLERLEEISLKSVRQCRRHT